MIKWLAVPVRGSSMQRINVQYFYQLASKLLPLRNVVADQKIMDSFSTFWEAEREIGFFINNPLLPPTTSFQNGSDLHQALGNITGKMFASDAPDYEATIDVMEVSNIVSLLDRFEILLQAEFSRRDIFAVSKKGLYSITELIENGEGMVSSSAREKMVDIIQDLHDAGRCVAFELPTAAAFHLYRSVEAATKTYIFAVRGTPVTDSEKKRGLGGFANILRQKNLYVDERIYTSVEQLVRLHRNPSIHPDRHISNAEVIGTMGMVVSVIEVMALDMDRRINTPSVPLSEILPDDSILPSGEDVNHVPQLTTHRISRRRRLNSGE